MKGKVYLIDVHEKRYKTVFEYSGNNIDNFMDMVIKEKVIKVGKGKYINTKYIVSWTFKEEVTK